MVSEMCAQEGENTGKKHLKKNAGAPDFSSNTPAPSHSASLITGAVANCFRNVFLLMLPAVSRANAGKFSSCLFVFLP